MSEVRLVPALDALVRHNVRFIVIGGVAGRARGSPSMTDDLAICYDRRADNLPKPTKGHDELLANASEVELEHLRVLVCSLDDLMRMKRAANRPKDRIELEILAAVKEEREKLGL